MPISGMLLETKPSRELELFWSDFPPPAWESDISETVATTPAGCWGESAHSDALNTKTTRTLERRPRHRQAETVGTDGAEYEVIRRLPSCTQPCLRLPVSTCISLALHRVFLPSLSSLSSPTRLEQQA